jgi:hypothetical protein
MAMYSKNGDYPITRDRFPHLLKDSDGKDYTAEHAFDNRGIFGWWDVTDEPVIDNNQVFTWKPNQKAQTWWEIRTKTPEELYESWRPGRKRRNRLLIESDWSQLIHEAAGDSIRWIGIKGNVIDESERQECETYRQKLRDLPSKYPIFENSIWPEMPAALHPAPAV